MTISHRFRRRARLGTCIAGVLAAAGSAPAGAQQAAGARAPGLEEITVTARRVEERLQDVPIAVSAYSQEMLNEAGVRDIVEIARMTPGFFMQDASRTNDTPFIRGMSVNSAFRDQQHAQSFVDGVFVQGLARTLDFNTEIERIEVVRGPQSALFGRATFAGAINYVTRKPTNDWEGRVVASLGQNDLRDLSVNVGGPIVDERLQFRLNGQFHDYGGQWTNALDGREIGGEQTRGGSAMLRWIVNDRLEFVLRTSKVKFDDGHPPTVVLGNAVNNCSLGGTRRFLCGDVPIPSAVSLNLADVDGGYRRTDQNRNYLRMDAGLGDYRLSGTVSYNDEQFDYFIDGDGTPLRSAGGAFQSLFVEKFRDRTADVRLESPTGGRVRWLAGVYWFDGWYAIPQLRPTFIAANPRSAINKSAYASVSWEVAPTLTLSLDGRYQNDRIYVENPTGARINDQTTTSFLPRAILDWKPSDRQTWYLSAAKGNRPASFNTVTGTPPDLVNVQEQTLWSYELGNRLRLLDGRVRLATAIYRINWNNQTTQQQIIATSPPSTTPRPIIINANVGKTRIEGAELEATWLPIDPLELRLAFSYNKAEYRTFLSDVCLAVLGNRTCPSGARLQNTPPKQGALSAAWRQPVGAAGWQWVTRGDLSWRDRMPMSEVNTATNPPATVLNVRTGLDAERWGLTLWVNNVTDEDAPAFATRFSDLNTAGFPYGWQVTLRRGREAGVTGTLRF